MTTQQKFTLTADVKPFCFEWTIHNYKPHGMVEGVIRSDPFTISGLDSTHWQLDLYPSGKRKSSNGHVSLYLSCSHNSDADCLQFPTTFSFTIKSANDKKDYTANNNQIRTFCHHSSGWGIAQFIKIKVLKERASDLLPNNVLTLICKGEVMLGMDCEKTDPEVPDGPGLLEDAKCMLESQVGRDVTLVPSDGSELPVHKFILCARSPVFAAMFDHDTEEKKTGRVVIKDMQPDVLRGLISFMYTDEAPADEKELAVDLLMASHKYEIPRLLDLMVKRVITTLTVKNVLNILSRAILLDLPKLKDACLQFIQTNSEEVRASQPWKKCADVDVFRVVSEFCLK